MNNSSGNSINALSLCPTPIPRMHTYSMQSVLSLNFIILCWTHKQSQIYLFATNYVLI